MKVPFLADAIVTALTPVASKILLFLCRTGKPTIGTIFEDAPRIGLSVKQWRHHIQPLLELGIIRYKTVRGSGYAAEVRYDGPRFTWVPSDPDLSVLTGRACKTLLAICRVLDNRTRTQRILVGTIARRIGMGLRSVGLAIKELRCRCIIDNFRTGRSSWYAVNKPLRQYFEQPHVAKHCPFTAHRKRLLLRLLLLLPLDSISAVLRTRSIAPPTRESLHRHVVRQSGGARESAVRRLLNIGMTPKIANHLADVYHDDDIVRVVKSFDGYKGGRRVSCPVAYFKRTLAKITRLRLRTAPT